ncbi:hypothetical protein [Tabrizicola sp. M-4]|uniref:hypothetical protein n=1 Tax=Tabrizicola sp. M-4 TaxID=3055847 RepID=UPI003DA7CAD0
MAVLRWVVEVEGVFARTGAGDTARVGQVGFNLPWGRFGELGIRAETKGRRSHVEPARRSRAVLPDGSGR